MSKPRAKTLQQRFGFQDHDLKMPLHDEIMIWLDKNAPTIIKELGWLNPVATRNSVRKSIDYARENECPENLIEDALNFEPKFNLVWEHPIKSGSLGFRRANACSVPHLGIS